MISIPLNLHRQQGIAVLVFSTLILFCMTLLTYFSSKTAVFEQKISRDDYRAKQSFQAAEAGLESGLVYLKNNPSTILMDSDSDGTIDADAPTSITNVALNNAARYTISYTNPIVSNFNLIQITASGQSDDGTVTTTVRQLVNFLSFLKLNPTASVISTGSVSLSGDSNIVNTATDFTIWSGSTITLNGSSTTTIQSGTASSGASTGTDTIENDSTLSSLTTNSFFEWAFNGALQRGRENADVLYNQSSNTNYNAILDGVEGNIIWIQQTSGTAEINSNTVIGSVDHPVILIVEGTLKISGDATIYGLVYLHNDWTNVGSSTSQIIGATFVNGHLSMTNGPRITFNQTVLNHIVNQLGYWQRVPGSWKDI